MVTTGPVESTVNATGTAIPRQTTTTNQLRGRCGKCHDPHGVTTNTSQVGNANNGVPLLKGTWLTSPYLEDRPGDKNFSWNAYANRNASSFLSYANWAR